MTVSNNMHQFAFTFEDLQRVLEAIRCGRSLPETPLKSLITFRRAWLESAAITNSIIMDVAMITWLTDEITEALAHQRHHHALKIPNLLSPRSETLNALADDFRRSDIELYHPPKTLAYKIVPKTYGTKA